MSNYIYYNDVPKYHKENDICPHCKEGKLLIVRGTFPYSEDYFICDKCDSTYPLIHRLVPTIQNKEK